MLDLSQFSLSTASLSTERLEFLARAPKQVLLTLSEILLLEAADRSVRETWQACQLSNLIKHARERSAFWRQRIPLPHYGRLKLADFPAFTRDDLMQQVKTEGPLLRPIDGLKAREHRTSGSSGRPVRFFITDTNSNYNAMRNFGEYWLEGLMMLNRARFRGDYTLGPPGFALIKKNKKSLSDIGLLKPQKTYEVNYSHPDPNLLLKALADQDFQIWVTNPGFMEAVLSRVSASDLYRTGLRHWRCMSGQIPEDVRTTLTNSGITVKSSYSSEEIGPIGFECPKFPDHYHVVSSNVLVEPSKEQFIQDGVQCNRILVTHLHSYATPLIKYDLGDLGRVLDQCPCGHNGQAISHLFGRVSGSLKRPDGTRSVFVIQNRRIVEIGGIKEYRARQVSLSKVVVDVVVDGDVPATKEKLLNLVTSVTGPGFEVDIRDCSEIDWGASTKRLSFRCEI